MKKKIFWKMRNFGKSTILWEYFHGNRYYGKIPMDIWHYALRLGEAGKHSAVMVVKWLEGLRNLVAKFPSERGNC
jgi:hypothetical protein